MTQKISGKHECYLFAHFLILTRIFLSCLNFVYITIGLGFTFWKR